MDSHRNKRTRAESKMLTFVVFEKCLFLFLHLLFSKIYVIAKLSTGLWITIKIWNFCVIQFINEWERENMREISPNIVSGKKAAFSVC
jgi:hypothetical protein